MPYEEGKNNGQPLHQRLFMYSQKWYWDWVTGKKVYVQVNQHGAITGASAFPKLGYKLMDPPEGEEPNE